MSAPDAQELPAVSVPDAIREVADAVILVDVREQDEWDSGHAPDARLLPLSMLRERASDLPKETRLLIVCQGGLRSLRATGFLRSEGLDAVNVEGGMIAWAAAGGPIIVDSHTANADET